MLSIHDDGPALCDGMTRREWLRIGGLGIAGLTLPNLLSARASSGKTRACILLQLLGGPPQHETWDPKPDAPAEVRGPFKPIATTVPGLRVCELMPKTAARAHHCAVLRAVSTGDSAHTSSGYYMLTGRPHQPMNFESGPPGPPNDWPCVGAVIRHLRGDKSGLPSAVTLPEHIWNNPNNPWPGQDAGWLGRGADPWLLHCDPSEANFQVPGLALPADVPPLRFDARRSLLDQMGRHLDTAARRPYDGQLGKAFDLLLSNQARRAFDLEREPPRVRDRYGRSRFAQSVLLARRLIEAGVGLVQINWTRIKDRPNFGGWDTHEKNAESLKSFLMPMMDDAYSALLDDLADRGLLDSTLVIWTGEFGRTPKHNGAAGRDHWGPVFSLALAGGGIRGGVVHGASDRIGAYPKDGRVQPPDLLATIFHCLGHAPETEIHDALGRPVPITRGEVIRPIVAG